MPGPSWKISQLISRLRAAWTRTKPWAVRSVLWPVVITRLVLITVGWFSQYFPPNVGYPIQTAVERGWHFSPHRLVGIWGRWDTGWHLSIVRLGYVARGDLETVQSNFAFFPLYPYILKFLSWFAPDQFLTPGVLVLLGAIVSTTCMVGALILLYRLVASHFPDEGIAQRSVLYLLLAPAGFFLSCAYTESLYLLLSIAAFWFASRRKWGIAAVCGCLLALTRPLGALILVPLVWLYMESVEWKLDRIRGDAAWFLLVPAGVFAFLLAIYPLTGDLLAPMHNQAAWRRGFFMPWVAFLNPTWSHPFVTPLDAVTTIVCILGAILALFVFRSASYGLYTLLLVLLPLFTGTLQSNTRYALVMFPVFVVLAVWGRRPGVAKLIVLGSFALQVLMMAAWCQFYFVG